MVVGVIERSDFVGGWCEEMRSFVGEGVWLFGEADGDAGLLMMG